MAPVLPAHTQTQGDFFPISEISSYHNKWVICARVTDKTPLRTFNRKVGAPGKVFTINLLDASGGEIRANFFNDSVDKYHDLMEVGKCFTFSRGSVRVANRQYNTTNHRYELTFDRADTLIEEVADNKAIQSVKFNFTDLKETETRTLPFVVDLCAIVTSFDPPVSVTARDGRALVKREIVVADDTAICMNVTLWGDRATVSDSTFAGNPTIALKGVSVREWNGGRSGSILQSGQMVFDPPHEEARKLKTWWAESGKSQGLKTLSANGVPMGRSDGRGVQGLAVNMMTLREEFERATEAPKMYTVSGVRLNIVQMRKQGDVQPLSYVACQESREGTNGLSCNRRLDESGFCASCNRAGKSGSRLNLRCRYADYSGSTWLTTFHEGAQRVVDLKADQVRSMEQSDREGLETLIASKYFMQPLQITVRSKLDSYQGEVRTNSTCVDVRPLPLKDHGRALLKEIHELAMA